MRIVFLASFWFAASIWAVAAFAQDAAAPATIPTIEVPALPPGPPIVTVSTAPLAPPDLASPYASPRDAARHRLQATLSSLTTNRDLKDGIQGFAQAYFEDSTYAQAAYDLAILAAIDEKWDDAAAALDQAARLDPRGLGATAAPQLERLKLLASLEKSADGRRKHRYDEALLRVLEQLPVLSFDAANSELAALGRIDAKRWEAPGLLAGLNGDGRGYETALKFLEIAVANATDPAIKTALETARKAAERELQYSSTRAAAEAASDTGDYAKAAELYQTAWTSIPARTENGLDAASSLLLSDDTAHASALLVRLRESGDGGVSELASAMLKQLEPIEPAAKAQASDAAQFFRDRGPREPVQIATLIPQVDRKPLEIYTRPLPKLVDDPGPVVLLASLAADAPVVAPVRDAPLPPLPPPSVPGESPWQEIASMKLRAAAAVVGPERPPQTVDRTVDGVFAHAVQVTSQPAGARVFLSSQTLPSSPDPACETPCVLRLPAGEFSVRIALAGYLESQQTITGDVQDLAAPLAPLRGSVIVETPTSAVLLVNGSPAGTQSPAELSLAPGLYRIGANSGSKTEERFLNVKPGARLKLEMLKQ